MATYAIGDVQGCYDELKRLLSGIQFEPARDRLWFVGDLVNRGPKSLEVLRLVRELGERAIVVLGNHDLHLVASSEGLERRRKDDTFDDVLRARDAKELFAWLRARPLMHVEGQYAMVHAGLLPQWNIAKALALAGEVQDALAGPGYRELLAHMYGGKPAEWRDDVRGWDRFRVIINAMTRMRFCTRAGRMNLDAKGAKAPRGYLAWYEARVPDEETILCGHWSALGLKLLPRVAVIDSGCVWGGSLSAMRLEDRALFQVRCRAYQNAGGDA
jgi:bis(5'-nucleosyl)-tetraphosphatase (symmetrical)